jgi:hypothetical protein
MSFLDGLINSGGSISEAAALELAQEIATAKTAVATLQATVAELAEGSPEQAAAIAELESTANTLTSQLAAVAAANDTQQTALDAAVALNTAQQAAITVQELLNITQTAALAAQEAANDTQQTAINAAASVNAAQEGAITSVQTTVAGHAKRLPTYLDLREYGTLTNANIDAAIDATHAEAKTMSAGIGLGAGGPGVIIKAPRGNFELAQSHHFPAPGQYEIAVGFEGPGMNELIFRAANGGAGSVFTFGSFDAAPSPLPHTFYLRVGGFSILAETEGNCKRNGITFYGPVNPLIQDIRVRGLWAPDALWSQGHAIQMLECESEGQRVNSQFPVIRDCDVFACMTGLYVVQAGPMSVRDSCFQGSRFQNIVADGVGGEFSNVGVQNSDDDAQYWFGNRRTANVVSGFSRTAGMASGTGATLGAAVGNLSPLTGVSGLTPHDEFRWIELTTAGASPNEVKVRGMYKIHSVAADGASAWIEKGSNHTSQAVAWQVRQGLDNIVTFSRLYDEGGSAGPMFGFYDSTNRVGRYAVRDCVYSTGAGAECLVEAQSCAVVEVKGGMSSAAMHSKLRFVVDSDIDAPIDQIFADEYSYPGLKCLRWTDSPNGGYEPRLIPHSSAGPISKRFKTAILEMCAGKGDYWTARAAPSLSLTATAVNSITGLINGTVLTPYAAKPTYVASDTEFEGPCIAQAVGNDVNAQYMRGTIPANKLPSKPYPITLIVISRTPTTTQANDRRIVASAASGPTLMNMLSFNDLAYAAGGGTWNLYHSATYGSLDGNNTRFAGSVNDTAPHIWIGTLAPNSHSSARSWDGDVGAAVGPSGNKPWMIPGTDLRVSIGTYDGNNDTGALSWVDIAVVPRMLSLDEQRALVDLARNDWRKLVQA